MTVSELIEQLQKMDPQAKTFIFDDGRAYCMSLDKIRSFSEDACKNEKIPFPSVVISSGE